MAIPVYLVANGDLRLSANRMCWPAQEGAERSVIAAIRDCGREVIRGHQFDPEKGHGFIDSQKRGMEVFRTIPPDAPLVVVEAVWQYSHHLLHGLLTHQGPILTVANWSGQWPGLVGMLNLNGSLTKAGVDTTRSGVVDFTRRLLPRRASQLARPESPSQHDHRPRSSPQPKSSCPQKLRRSSAVSSPPNCAGQGDHGRLR